MGTLNYMEEEDVKLRLQKEKQKLPLWLLLQLWGVKVSSQLVWASVASLRNGEDHGQPGSHCRLPKDFAPCLPTVLGARSLPG